MAVRRFEYKSRRTHVFWEIEVVGNACTVCYGKIGSDGRTRIQAFATAEQATAEADRQVRAKIRKGYKPIRPVVVSEEMARWLVRADELQAAGDPWGQRIALWIACATPSTRHYQLLEELNALNRAHAQYFYGPALALLRSAEGFSEVACLVYEYGYCVEASIGGRKSGDNGPHANDVVRAVVQAPICKPLRWLTIGRHHFEAGGLERVGSDIASGGVLPELEHLKIGDFDGKEQEISDVLIGDLSPLWAATPKLRTLRLRGGGVELGELVHPSLSQLQIETTGLSREAIISLAHAKLPELSDMKLRFGRQGHGGATASAALRPLFTSKTLPKLRRLCLQSAELQDEIAIALSGSPLLAQLEHVDLGTVPVHERGVEAILANAASFQHLQLLKLEGHAIDVDHYMRLRQALGRTVLITREWRPSD